jgi:hypothetical protein
MTAPGDSVLIFLLLALLVACSGYAAGRLHQRWQTALDREEAYRDGYETGTRSVFSTAVRMLGPRRPVRASAPVQKAGPGLAAEPTVPVAAGPALSFPLPEPPPPYAVPEPPALGGVTYHKFPDPRLTAEEGLTGPQPRLAGADIPAAPSPRSRLAGADIPAAPSPRSRVSGAETPAGSGPRPAGTPAGSGPRPAETPAGPHPHPAGAGTPAAPGPRLAGAEAPTDSRPRLADRSGLALGAPAKAAAPDAAPDAVAEAARRPGPAPRRRPSHRADTEAGRTPAAPSAASTSGRHTVPDELVQATTYRLPPDRVFRAKVKESSRLPEEPTTKLSVPKPRKS